MRSPAVELNGTSVVSLSLLFSTKRSMSGERSLRPAKFDELCDKLADKYGENPESVWRETVGDDIADDAGEVDWYEPISTCVSIGRSDPGLIM